MTDLEAQKLLADAILLERAVAVLDRTSRKPYEYSALHWLDIKETLREVAQAKRTEAEGYDRPGRDGSGTEEADIRGAVPSLEG